MKKQFKPRRRREDHGKPVIETLINTTALALTSFGVMQITNGSMDGYIPVLVGMLLEYFKYWGRKTLW